MEMDKILILRWAVSIVLCFFCSGRSDVVAITSVSNDELSFISNLLLDNDVNNAAQYVYIDIQRTIPQGQRDDKAPKRLITVDPLAFNIPTISKLRLLFDNYIADVNVAEHVNMHETVEERDLLDAIVDTPVMEITHNFLAEKGYVQNNQKSFRDVLHKLWFGMYRRGKKTPGSSGIEHVFLGEIKNGKVSGFHNWVFFNNEEVLHRADYLGYVKEVNLGMKGYVLKLNFKWKNTFKSVGSMFVGTSPELEMALYTICYFTRPNALCHVTLGGQSVSIQTYTVSHEGKHYIGSAFPVL